MYYDREADCYWYYENNAYDSHNACLNNAPILLKLSAGEMDEEKYAELFGKLTTLKNRGNELVW